MAEQEEEQQEQQEGDAAGSSRKWLLPLGIVLVLAAAAAILIIFIGETKEPQAVSGMELEGGIQEVEDLDKVLSGAVLRLDDFIVNLNSENVFLKFRVALEFYDFELPPYIERKVPRIRDAILQVVTNKKPRDLLKPHGKDLLRAEILNSLSSILDEDDKVVDLYFMYFVVQEA